MPTPKRAIVTGASSGVGIDFARELAARGYELILVARRSQSLAEVAEKISAEFDVKITQRVADLADADHAIRFWNSLKIESNPVEVLVNNAGMGQFGPALELDLDQQLKTIDLNSNSLTALTLLAAQHMKEQGGGYILNHSSYSAIQPEPWYAVYSGTKSYVLTFSQALANDLRKDNIYITALCSGFFDSEFFSKSGQAKNFFTRWITLTPEHVAKAGVSGLFRKKPVVIPGWFYKIFNVVSGWVPRSVSLFLAHLVVGEDRLGDKK